MRFWIILAVLSTGSLQLSAQTTDANWQDHLSYRDATQLCLTPGYVQIASRAGVARCNKSTGSFSTLSKGNGLTDAGISAIAYCPVTATTVVGYTSGGIDLVTNGTTRFMDHLKNHPQYPDKSINHIFCHEGMAYLSCNFGILSIDLRRSQLSSVLPTGNESIPPQVRELCVLNGFLYAATSQGIRRAPLGGDLSNPAVWSLVANIPNHLGSFTHIASTAQRLVACFDSTYLYQTDGLLWQPYSLPDEGSIGVVEISGNEASILILRQDNLIRDNALLTNAAVILSESDMYLTRAQEDLEGIIWISSLRDGLLRLTASGTRTTLHPPGPAVPLTGSILIGSNGLYATGEGADGKTTSLERYSNGTWTHVPLTDGAAVVALDIHPGPSEEWAVSVHDEGLMIFRDQQLWQQFSGESSPWNIEGLRHPSGVGYDPSGTLWTTPNGTHPVAALAPNEPWKTFLWNPGSHSRLIHFDVLGQGWIAGGNEGLLVFNTSGTLQDENDDRTLKFYPRNIFGETIYRVHCLANDLDGSVWVGTEKGLVIFPDPAGLLRGINTGGTHIVVPGKDDPHMVFPLLGSEPVLSLAVDGANRKWVGTASGGAFLLSADGQKELLHFTPDNSPLSSGKITGIAVHPQNGEVYFQTEYGVVRYQGGTIAAEDDFSNMYIYPNPVRETFSGEITFTNLVRNTHLKVTDIGGNLVFETLSEGGSTTWDGRDFRGKRVASGVYLVFCSSEDGSETRISKLLIIR